jgi:hypothetical protein
MQTVEDGHFRMVVREEKPPFRSAGSRQSIAPPSEQQITSPGELENTSPGEPQITPLVIHSSLKENNKKRTNNGGKVPVACSETVTPRAPETTASPPPMDLSDATKIILERRIAKLRKEIATAVRKDLHDRAVQLYATAAPVIVMNISRLAHQVRGTPLREVLTHYGFDVKREGTTLRAKTERHNIVVTGGRWFDNKANVGGGGAIDLVMHIAGVDFSVACRSLADEFRPFSAGQASLSFPSSPGNQPATRKKSFEELIALYAVRDDSTWRVARAYLSETRKIDPAIVDEMHAVGSIYANGHRPNPSLVFLHRDPHGKVRGATLRDTRHQSAFRPCLGNKLTAWFAVGNLAKAERVVAVESPIDALSYYSLFAGRCDALAVVSCAGSTVPHE